MTAKTNTFRIERSLHIAASPEAILPLIADLKRHEAWSPFSKPDPKMKVDVYAGRPGAGQSRTFAGGSSGSGRCSIEAVEPSRVRMTLAMTRPLKATNTVEYLLKPDGEGTVVTWVMSGPMTLMGRVMNLFVDCDAMCGKMFTQGLGELKAVAEQSPATRLAA